MELKISEDHLNTFIHILLDCNYSVNVTKSLVDEHLYLVDINNCENKEKTRLNEGYND